MQIADVDYYKVLGVSSEASASEIKQKYRELSKKYHPDTTGGDTQRMSQINEAYAVLSDPLKRQDYTPPSTRKSSAEPRYSKTTKNRQTSVKKRREPEPEEEPENQWMVFLSYVLAIPLAILVINFGLPAFKQLLPKGRTVIIEEQTPQTSVQPAPSQVTNPNFNAQNSASNDTKRSNIFYYPVTDDSTN